MPSLQALPQELIHHIVDLLVEIDIGGAISLVQTCKTFSQATGYHRVRYLYLREKKGYPRRKRLPHNVRHEADLLLANEWPHLGSRHCTLPLSQSKGWHCVPTEIQEAGSAVMLSGAARLHGEYIYDVAADGLSLYRFQILAGKEGAEQLSDGVKTTFEEPILCYDVDVEENVLAVLAASATGLRLSVLDLSSKTVKQTLIVDKEGGYEYRYVGVNGGSVLVSLDNNVQVIDWKQRHTATEGAVTAQTKWARQSKESSLTGKYVRASLLSPDVVACTVLSTLRTIGSMRVCQGVVELYRLDQYVPRVADILLPEASVDALQPRILQDPRSYISFDLGGKTALQECLARGHDGPAIIQTLSDTRIGRLSTLCDMLYPKAALALYSFDPSKPNYPTLGNEWLRSNFPLLQGATPLQSSLDGRRMVSSSRRGKNELIYWTSRDGGLQAIALQDVRPSLPLCDSGQHRRYHIDLVSLDGPRALFTCFDCVDQHNGTLCATGPRCSLWTTLAPPRTDV